MTTATETDQTNRRLYSFTIQHFAPDGFETIGAGFVIAADEHEARFIGEHEAWLTFPYVDPLTLRVDGLLAMWIVGEIPLNYLLERSDIVRQLNKTELQATEQRLQQEIATQTERQALLKMGEYLAKRIIEQITIPLIDTAALQAGMAQMQVAVAGLQVAYGELERAVDQRIAEQTAQ